MTDQKNYVLKNSDLVKQDGETKSLFLQFNENLAFSLEITNGMPAKVLFAKMNQFMLHMDATMHPEEDAE